MTTPVELAGKPSRIGGTITQAVAWSLIVGGLVAAIIVAAILLTLTSTGALGWVIGGVIALATLAIGVPLLVGGRALRNMGVKARRAALERAVFALASQRGGVLTAGELAHALRVDHEEADAFLTELAKRADEPVRVDIDDEGQVLYRVNGMGRRRVEGRFRVEEEAGPFEGPDESIEREELERSERRYDST